MGKIEIQTTSAPTAIGPYSQALIVNDTVYVSGQLPIDPTTGSFAGVDIASQAEQSLKNIQAVLAAEGLTMDNVVKTTVLLKDMSDFAAMNEVYGRFFKGVCPARAAFQVVALPKDALVEIEAIASR